MVWCVDWWKVSQLVGRLFLQTRIHTPKNLHLIFCARFLKQNVDFFEIFVAHTRCCSFNQGYARCMPFIVRLWTKLTFLSSFNSRPKLILFLSRSGLCTLSIRHHWIFSICSFSYCKCSKISSKIVQEFISNSSRSLSYIYYGTINLTYFNDYYFFPFSFFLEIAMLNENSASLSYLKIYPLHWRFAKMYARVRTSYQLCRGGPSLVILGWDR